MDQYFWNWQEQPLKKLLISADTVLVGGIVSNQSKFYDLFDALFLLTVDSATLQHRLFTRPDELADILKHQVKFKAEVLANPKSISIDAAQPIDKIAQNILEHIDDRTDVARQKH